MSRHAKNNTASSYFTYHERQQLDYGTKKQRLGKDSLRSFDCCCLSLQPVVDPVVTPHGFLYSREAICENLLSQKQEHKRKLQQWKEQQQRLQDQQEEKKAEVEKAKIERFEEAELSILPKTTKALAHGEKYVPPPPKSKKEVQLRIGKTPEEIKAELELKQKVEEHAKRLRAFWVPALGPDAAETILPKPSSKTYCSLSGKPLRLKQLLPVDFTPLKNVSKHDTDKLGKWMCPLCYTPLTNKVLLSVLKTSRKIMCKTCVEKVVRSDMKDPFTNAPVMEKDIIHLQAAGTGFAGRGGGEGQDLVAKRAGVAFVG